MMEKTYLLKIDGQLILVEAETLDEAQEKIANKCQNFWYDLDEYIEELRQFKNDTRAYFIAMCDIVELYQENPENSFFAMWL